MAVHLLHELIAIRSQLAGAMRLTSFAKQHAGIAPESSTIEWLQVATRANDEAIGNVHEWLGSQVIGLHDPARTTAVVKDARNCPPRYDG